MNKIKLEIDKNALILPTLKNEITFIIWQIEKRKTISLLTVPPKYIYRI